MSEFLSGEEAARLLDCSPRTVRRFIASGRLPGFRVGPRLLRVRRSDLESLLQPIPSAAASTYSTDGAA